LLPSGTKAISAPNNLVDRRFIIPVDKRGRIVIPPELRRDLGTPCRIVLDRADDATAR